MLAPEGFKDVSTDYDNVKVYESEVSGKRIALAVRNGILYRFG